MTRALNVLAIDFGGSEIKLGLFADEQLLQTASLPAHSEQGLRPRLADTEALAHELLRQAPGSRADAVGISMPGIVDSARRQVTGLYGKYEDSLHMDLPAWCRAAFGAPMVLGMDSKLALLGELHYGCARGYRDAAMLIFGTGVGTAVAYGGEVLESRNHTAGALCSHMVVELNGETCTCPGRGCLEATASGWALPRFLRAHPLFPESLLAQEPALTFRALERGYLRGDELAELAVARCAAAWRAGILSMVHAFNPEAVILSGGIMRFDALYRRTTDGIESEIWDCCRPVAILRAERPERSVLYGLLYEARKHACTL